MKVMVIVKATKESEAGVLPDEKLLADMGRYNEELVKAGILLMGEGLHPSSKGVRVRFSGAKRTVIDGPFAETKELAAGFWMWRVKSMAEAIEWLKRCPNPMLSDSEIEIRPVFEAEDFGEAFTPELREGEAAVRAQALGLKVPRFENGRELIIAGMNQNYTAETRSQIPAQWERFVPHLGAVPSRVGQNSYGVCWNSTPDCRFDYLCGVEVSQADSIPADFSSVRIPAGRYAVFTHDDHVSLLPRTIDVIWGQWLPDSSLKSASSPCFERYTEEFNPQTGVGGMEIWIPIQAALRHEICDQFLRGLGRDIVATDGTAYGDSSGSCLLQR
jgi:AraC family transcriptional regulator